jgi:hypothetical protein
VVLEVRLLVPVGVRERGPELDAVQVRVARAPRADRAAGADGVLGVRDPEPGGHDVELAGVHRLA